ncbi:MAG TPA: class I SAM-dependent methyltransferase, partial [Solirubrobacteraceae bacterium]|nr:class I SAM-dependent methyltransferase [Solirubrobacteraceae bacterium]
GLAVGADASAAMLAYAARTATAPNTAYVRCDAATLPFRPESFDAICCFGALHLFAQPLQALDEIVRVLAPGGRVALLAARLDLEEGRRLRITRRVLRALTGARPFAREELPQALREHCLGEVEAQVAGGAQFVAARRPAA